LKIATKSSKLRIINNSQIYSTIIDTMGQTFPVGILLLEETGDLRKVGCILWVLRFPQANQTNRYDIAGIVLESGVKHHNHRNKVSEYFQ
jgi:hypothetical protein